MAKQKFEEPLNLGRIIIDDHTDWRYEGEADIPQDNLEKIAQFVLADNPEQF